MAHIWQCTLMSLIFALWTSIFGWTLAWNRWTLLVTTCPHHWYKKCVLLWRIYIVNDAWNDMPTDTLWRCFDHTHTHVWRILYFITTDSTDCTNGWQIAWAETITSVDTGGWWRGGVARWSGCSGWSPRGERRYSDPSIFHCLNYYASLLYHSILIAGVICNSHRIILQLTGRVAMSHLASCETVA